jgi:hypothetical protein
VADRSGPGLVHHSRPLGGRRACSLIINSVSSSAKADDPVRRRLSVNRFGLWDTGCPAFAGHDNGEDASVGEPEPHGLTVRAGMHRCTPTASVASRATCHGDRETPSVADARRVRFIIILPFGKADIFSRRAGHRALLEAGAPGVLPVSGWTLQHVVLEFAAEPSCNRRLAGCAKHIRSRMRHLRNPKGTRKAGVSSPVYWVFRSPAGPALKTAVTRGRRRRAPRAEE